MAASLREIFTPLFAYVLLFAHTSSYQRRSFHEIRGAIERLLEEQRVLRHAVAPSDYEDACFAVIAWVDELVLTCVQNTNPDLFDEWRKAPFQYERYGLRTAGEEFFLRLERLGPAQREVREIYHLCLCLGFLGEYYGDPQKLNEIRRELARDLAQQLNTPFLDRDDIQRRSDEPLTPEPYQVKSPPQNEQDREGQSVLRYVAAAFAGLAIVLLVVLWLWKPPTPPPPPRVEPIRPDLAAVQEKLKFFQCCQFADVNVKDDGTVSLKGQIENDTQRNDVQQALLQVQGVTKVEVDSLTTVPRPFCEVIDLLTPLQQQGNNLGFALQIRPDKGCDAIYKEKDRLVVEVTAGKPLQYVYVDYYTADRANVEHLLPNPNQPDNFLKGAPSLSLGKPGSTEWEISPPLGLEMVTVITSPQKLFDQPQLQLEAVNSYLPNLRSVLDRPARAEIAATYCFITSKER